jgi:DNA-binding transcriptional LysR family regulator
MEASGRHGGGGARGSLPCLTVSLTQIQSFVAVAEEGHVGRAAKRLFLTQPPLSRHILALEDELGTPLFERTPRGMRLMPAGEAFLPHARQILGAVEAAVHAVRDLRPCRGDSRR